MQLASAELGLSPPVNELWLRSDANRMVFIRIASNKCMQPASSGSGRWSDVGWDEAVCHAPTGGWGAELGLASKRLCVTF